MAKTKYLSKINDGDQTRTLMQNNMQQAVGEFIRSPLIDGRLVEATLVPGTNKIAHKLARKINGYFLVRSNTVVNFFEETSDDKYLQLQVSTNAIVSFWIF